MSELDPQRIGKITASRIVDMMAGGKGITRAKYAAELAAARMTGKPHRNTFSSSSMEHGTEFEPFARIQYEIRNGVMVQGTGKEFICHPFVPNSGCSPDGLIDDVGAVEFKCPETHTFIEYKLSGEVPKKYQLQILWQLACTRRKWCDFVAYDPDLPEEDGYFQVRYEPSEKEISALELDVRLFDAEVNQLIETIKSKRK